MGDSQDQAESLDEDTIGGEYPPDKLMGAEAYGEAGAEPGAPESVERRAAREEPEERPEPLGYPDDDAVDDAVQEHEAPIPAEEAAVHEIDESLGGFDSEVDDPELEAAYEIDPEVQR
ncbi:hypothetical protein ACE2AJ_06270 [Aquihabitans daechungensis]|uniref:hypothetical protein n=1 Tax=Aquihabitans daechungensis TaxID=1052257 RepID=UPI003B9F5B37